MHKHHEESVQNLTAYFEPNKSVLALFLGGSVAKGLERPDSDIDAEVVVTDEYYAALKRENRLTECVSGHCTYEGGYFDIKYFTKDFLAEAAARGSEPTRNAFVKCRCLFCREDGIERTVSRIGVFQESEKSEKMDSFYSALALNYRYFWRVSSDNLYLRMRSATDVLLFGYRLLLQENSVLFPCHKSLEQTVGALEKKPAGILAKGERLLRELSDGALEDFYRAIVDSIDYKPPEKWSEILTRYTEDNELWWYKARPLIAEW